MNDYINAQLEYNNINLKVFKELNKIKKIEKPLHSKNIQQKKDEINEYKGIFFFYVR